MGWRRPLLASALASAILVIAVLIVWRGNRPATSPAPGQARTGGVATTPGTATPQPPTTEPAPHVSARPSSAPETFALSLVPGLARAPGRPATLEIAPGATTIRIRLDLDGAGYASYRAALATADGEEVWRREGLTALQPGGMAVGITLPAAILPPGDYVVRLSGATPPDAFEEIAFYAFRVVGR